MNLKENIKTKNIEQLNNLAQEIRIRIIEVLSKNGGHVGPSLGAVDLIIAMHHVFDSSKTPFIFDVSHQAYAHKLITERWDEFDSIRQFQGLSGYCKPSESEDDYFIAGHSSTSISLAVGAAKAFTLNKEDRFPIAFIGDGAMSAGLAYEALNELGNQKYPSIIILNDNEMSISTPIGAISNYLSQTMASPTYQKFKRGVESVVKHLPESAEYIAKRFEDGFKLITPGVIFEELGLEYIGPIDGHDINQIVSTLKKAAKLKKPVLIHARTIKGKGYKPAEGPKEKWHGVGPFDLETGKNTASSNTKSATAIFGETLYKMAQEDDKIVGITAAMPSGTGLSKLISDFPNRFWDVAIAEQHAVTSAASLAKEGFKPYIAIYSTFLQRAFDQIIHDTCIMNLPVTFAIDRAGIVGADGETHQGAFDISYLRAIPNMTILAPRDEQSLINIMNFTSTYNAPCAFRYPRGSFELIDFKHEKIQYGKSQLLKKTDSNTLFIGYGTGVSKAINVANKIKDTLDVALLDLIFVKPLDKQKLIELSQKYSIWYVFSDSAKMGGVGSAILEFLSDNNIYNIKLKSYEYEDEFIPHGDKNNIEKLLNIDTESIAKDILLYHHKRDI